MESRAPFCGLWCKPMSVENCRLRGGFRVSGTRLLMVSSKNIEII